MHYLSRSAVALVMTFLPVVQAIDSFTLQISKAMHEELSLNHGVYSPLATNRWASDCPWFQNPGVSARFASGSVETESTRYENEVYTPGLSLRFRTIGQVEVGLVYAHEFSSYSGLIVPFGVVSQERDTDSVGAYVARQFAGGFKLGGAFNYSASEQGFEDSSRREHSDQYGASGGVGFARSFGEKRIGRNMFVDTSANFLFDHYERNYDVWHFLWMAKVGHNITEDIAIYGLFNLFHWVDAPPRAVPQGTFTSYRDWDDTWGEAGGGIFVRFCPKLRLTAEATTPVLDEPVYPTDSYEVRAGLHFDF